jgi:hypothetical protein
MVAVEPHHLVPSDVIADVARSLRDFYLFAPME